MPSMHRLAAVLFLCATFALAAGDAVTCTGVWSASTSEEALVKQFGRTNVKRDVSEVILQYYE